MWRASKRGAGGERRMKWSELVTNEEVVELIGEKRTILNNTQCRKAN